MEPRRACLQTATPDHSARAEVYHGAVRRLGRSLLSLGLLSALGSGGRCAAQTPPALHLTVHPRELATGIRNPPAGVYLLDSFPDRRTFADPTTPEDYSVYVPEQCAGARRCPLLTIFYQGGMWNGIGDTYGMILLFLPNILVGRPPDSVATGMDRAMRQVFRTFAVDPSRVALAGTCGTGGQAYAWGRSNPDVFNRVVVLSPEGYFAVAHPPPPGASEFYVIAGIDEADYFLRNAIKFSQVLRHDGVPFKEVLSLRDHPGKEADYLLAGRWLQESWTTPDPAARPAPSPMAVPLPVLTAEALHQVTAFWSRFMQEPDSIRETARQTHLREVLVPIGREPMTILMTDFAALAGQYPSVASAFEAAGLTAGQHEAYRLALITARAAKQAGAEIGAVEATSVLGQNIAFLEAHRAALDTLDQTNMWRTR